MNKKAIIGLVVAAIIIPSVGYAISPYFTESTINEELPDNIAITGEVTGDEMEDAGEREEGIETEMMEDAEMMKGEEMVEGMEGSDMMEGMEAETVEEAEMMETEEMMEDASMENDMTNDGTETTIEDAVDEAEADVSVDDDEMVEGADMQDGHTGGGAQAQENANDKVIPVTYSGTFVGVNDGIHNAEGVTLVLPLDDGSQILRLEEFHSTNGPDLYVYLATDKRASDFVNLGDLKANRGNQNYEIPQGTDLEKYDNVLIWCKQFSVLFGSSEISPDN